MRLPFSFSRHCFSQLAGLAWLLAACQQPPAPSGSEAGPTKPDSEAGSPSEASPPASKPADRVANPVANPAANPNLPELPAGPLPAARDGYELVTPGSGPLARLRFTPQVGQVERVEMTLRMTMSISGAGVPPTAQNIPPIKQITRAETVSISDGQIVAKFVFERFDVERDPAIAEGSREAQLADLMQAKIQEVAGFEQQVTYDARGGVIEGNVSIPPDINKQLAQTLETMAKSFRQVLVRLPEPEVGVGALWRETSNFPNNGIELEQTSQFELSAREGDRLTLISQVSQRPLSETINSANLPSGEVKLVEFDSRGSGRIVYELGRILPTEVDTQMRTHFVIEATAMGRTQQIGSDIQIELSLRRVE